MHPNVSPEIGEIENKISRSEPQSRTPTRARTVVYCSWPMLYSSFVCDTLILPNVLLLVLKFSNTQSKRARKGDKYKGEAAKQTPGDMHHMQFPGAHSFDVDRTVWCRQMEQRPDRLKLTRSEFANAPEIARSGSNFPVEASIGEIYLHGR